MIRLIEDFKTRIWMMVFVLLVRASCCLTSEIVTLKGCEFKEMTHPRIAFNTIDRLCLVVWEHHFASDDWDIVGHLMDRAGQPIGDPFNIPLNDRSMQEEPDLAYNPITNEFLVVYTRVSCNCGGVSIEWRVSGSIVGGDGTPSLSFPISSSSAKEFHPVVACDPISGDYLVAYEREYQSDNMTPREVWAQRVHRDGTLIGDAYRVSASDKHSYQCAIACAGGQFFIVWNEQSSKGQIGARVIQMWKPVETIITIASQNDSMGPQLAYNPARAEYMVVYQTRTSSKGTWTIEGTRVNTLGELSSATPIYANSKEHCQAPAVSYNTANGHYGVVWAQGQKKDEPLLASHRIWRLGLDDLGAPMGIPTAVSDSGKALASGPGVPAAAISIGFCHQGLIVWEQCDQCTTAIIAPPYRPPYLPPNFGTSAYIGYSILSLHQSFDNIDCD